jgi:thiol-disulfide isomerase/thioredoxin
MMRRIPFWAYGFGVVFLAWGSLFYWAWRDRQNHPSAAAPVEISTTAINLPEGEMVDPVLAPEFKLADVSTGKEFRLSEQRGKVVLLDFWATWCGPCRRVIPSLVELQNSYGDKVQVIGVSVDRPDADVAGFCRDTNIAYLVGVDADREVARLYGGISGIPTVVVISRSGKVLASYVGGFPKEHYDALIKMALSKA